MRVHHTKRPLPRHFARHPAALGLIAEHDIRMKHGRLHAKLLIFDKPVSLRAFWKAIRGVSLGRSALGAVNALAYERINFMRGDESHSMECDPRYFCMIGLCKTHLSMEIISHEATHAGFAYAKRRKGDAWIAAMDFDEEFIAYPAGRIAASINRFLYRKKLYEQRA